MTFKDKEAKIKELIDLLDDIVDTSEWEFKVGDSSAEVFNDHEIVPANFSSQEDFNAGVEFVTDLLRNGWTKYSS